MNKIQNLKIILGRSFGKTFMYEFDFILNEETVIEILGKSISKRKCKIEDGVLECTYEIEKNINKLKSVNTEIEKMDAAQLNHCRALLEELFKSISAAQPEDPIAYLNQLDQAA